MPHPDQPSYEELAARNAELTRGSRIAGGGGGAGRADRVAAGRGSGAAPAGGPGFLEFLAAPEPGRPGGWRRRRRPAGGRRGGRGRAGRRAGRKAIRVRAWRGPPGRMRPWPVEPGTCGGCGADLAGAPGRVASSVQVADIPPAALTVTEYQMMRRDLRVRAGHDRPAAAGRDRRPGLLRPERGGCGDAAGQHGRDRDRAGRGPDGRPAQGAGLDGFRVAVPGPPGRGVNRRRVRGRPQGRPEGGGRARHRRDPRPADHRGHQRGGLRQPARLHGADHARL